MPIKPNEVPMVDSVVVDKVIDTIDHALVDVVYARSSVRGMPENPHWQLVGPGTLTDAEKQVIIKQYEEAGWGCVDVVNSHERNERPGLWCVVLYKNKQLKRARNDDQHIG